MYPDSEGHLHICENDIRFPDDPKTYMEYSYWNSLNTPPDHPNPNQSRIAFFGSGSINLTNQVDPRILQSFCGDGPGEKSTFLHIDLCLPLFIDGQWQHESAVPTLAIAGWDKGQDNHTGGWHLYNFGVDVGKNVGVDDLTHITYGIWGHFGVRGDLFRITRLNYSIVITGFQV